MNVIATTICFVVAALCWTWLRTRGQALEVAAEAKRLEETAAERVAQKELVLAMANKGYVQVPVIHTLDTEAGASEDEDDWEDNDHYSEHRTWQLAWVPKDQMETLLILGMNPDAGDADLLEAALRPD